VSATRAVGRIEVEGHDLAWLGTGWLVRPDVMVTNRHVAAEFGRHDGTTFVFKQGMDNGRMRASIGFLEETESTKERTFRLDRILHIEDSNGPDLAFLHVAGEHSLATPITLSTDADDNEMVAVIGYPARDSRIPDQQLMDQIFGNVYDKKRLAPGQLTGSGSWAAMIGKSPAGDYELALLGTEEMRGQFRDGKIEDIMLVIGYSGRTVPWAD
jgi:endonuclease G